MTNHVTVMKPHVATLQQPSTAVVFTKNPSVMDSLCNHKEFADGEEPACTCDTLQQHIESNATTTPSSHFCVDGDALTFSSAPLTSIASGSLQNKIFPPKKEIFKSFQKAFDTWHRKNLVPSLPLRHLAALWQSSWSLHNQHLHKHVTHKDITRFKQLFPGSVFHNEDKPATSLRIYFPCLYFECLETTFADPKIPRRIDISPEAVMHTTIEKLTTRFKKQYPWSLGRGKKLPNAYVLPKTKETIPLRPPYRLLLFCPVLAELAHRGDARTRSLDLMEEGNFEHCSPFETASLFTWARRYTSDEARLCHLHNLCA